MLLNAPGTDDFTKVVCAGVGQCGGVKRATLIACGTFKVALHAARYKIGGPAAQGAAALERGIGAGPALAQQREHVVTNVVAVNAGKPVGRLPNAFKPVLFQPVFNVLTTPVQKRPVQPAAPKAASAWDAGQPGGAGAAQQPQDDGFGMIVGMVGSDQHRSEEHTSELQSRGHLVCRLLLEKKKQ